VSTLTPQVEPLGTKETGRCKCCGRVSRMVWGVVHRGRLTLATYYVHWTVGHVFETGAHIDVVLGKWGEGSSAEDRYAVRLAYRIFDHGPELMVIDASHKHVLNTFAARCLKRSDVIGSPLAQNVFDICDAFLEQDKRLAALWDVPGL
jgi:hypothetical protein